MASLVCVLDPGHGGTSDPFRTSPRYRMTEAEANLTVALRIKHLCESQMDVHLTRTEDKEMSIADRVAMAKTLGAHIFLSIHHNFTTLQSDNLAHPMVFVHQPYRYLSPLVRHLGLDLLQVFDRRVYKKMRLPPKYPESGLVSGQTIFSEGMGVLRGLGSFCPALITEAGFLSDSQIEHSAVQGSFLEDEAYAISNVLCHWADQRSISHVSWHPVSLRFSRATERVLIEGQVTTKLSSGTIEACLHDPALSEPRLWGGFDVQRREGCLYYKGEMDIPTFLQLEALSISNSECQCYPDLWPCIAPHIQAHGDWHALWPKDIATAVRDQLPASDEMSRWVAFGLKLFPNHPYHIEARQYLESNRL